MVTENQLKKGYRRPCPDEKDTGHSPRIKPQCFYSGVISKLRILNPKKPNSAERKAAEVTLSNGISVLAYIPGEGHSYQPSAKVLVRRGRRKDLIGVRWVIVRKGEHAVKARRNARSKYGTAKPAAKDQ
jgi:small subunit ribosomal protein S12